MFTFSRTTWVLKITPGTCQDCDGRMFLSYWAFIMKTNIAIAIVVVIIIVVVVVVAVAVAVAGIVKMAYVTCYCYFGRP